MVLSHGLPWEHGRLLQGVTYALKYSAALGELLCSEFACPALCLAEGLCSCQTVLNKSHLYTHTWYCCSTTLAHHPTFMHTWCFCLHSSAIMFLYVIAGNAAELLTSIY